MSLIYDCLFCAVYILLFWMLSSICVCVHRNMCGVECLMLHSEGLAPLLSSNYQRANQRSLSALQTTTRVYRVKAGQSTYLRDLKKTLQIQTTGW